MITNTTFRGNRIIAMSEFDIRVHSCNLTPEEVEDFEERAAIMQYEGQLSKTKAETMALECILGRRRAHLKAS